jgi:hypothetical protein
MSNSGNDSVAQERLPDGVMLDDFERLLEIGEVGPTGNKAESLAMLCELARFLDEHGRRLLLLGRICHQAMERQSKEPT